MLTDSCVFVCSSFAAFACVVVSVSNHRILAELITPQSSFKALLAHLTFQTASRALNVQDQLMDEKGEKEAKEDGDVKMSAPSEERDAPHGT